MRRCDEYDRDQARWRREQAARATNWGGYNYRPVLNNVENYKTGRGGRILGGRTSRCPLGLA
jgi:hypothetical protein